MKKYTNFINENSGFWILKKGKEIGRGGYGIVYDVIGEPYKVLKITTDESEYNNAKSLIGKKNEYLVNYYACESYEEKYLLIMDKLDKPSEEVSHLLDDINIHMYDYDENLYYKTIFLSELDFLIDDFSEKENKETVIFVFDNLKKIVEECKENNIYTNDFHSGNIGEKDNKLIFFDIGASEDERKINNNNGKY